MGGDLGEATRLVNAIRERAYGNSDHNYTSVTLDDIYNERGYELAFEFVRRQDMIRFGTYLKPRYMKPKQTPEYRKIFPIPFKVGRRTIIWFRTRDIRHSNHISLFLISIL